MPANNKQKLKLLYVYRMLMEETDASKGLTMTDILTKLAEQGIEAERKSIYKDVEALKQFGVEVITLPRSPVEYAVAKGKFSLSELALLIDAVQGTTFLTDAKSKQLVRGVKALASSNQRALLDKQACHQ